MRAESHNSNSELQTEALGGSLFANGVLQFLHYVFPIVTLPFVGQMVGPESFGIINYFSVVVGYFTLFVIYGFDFSGTREVANLQGDPQKLAALYSKVQSAKLILLSFAALMFAFLIPLLPAGPNHEKIAWATFGVTAGWALMPNWFVQGLRQMKSLLWINIFPKVIFILIVFFLITGPKDAYIYPLSISASSLMVALLSVFMVRRKFQVHWEVQWNMEVLRYLYRERWIFLSGLVNNLNQTINVLVLGFFVTFDIVGHFALGWRLMNVTQVLVMFPIMQSLFPLIGSAIQKNQALGLKRLNRNLPLIFSAILLSTIFMFIMGPWIIVQWFGVEFVESVWILRVLLIVPFITASSHIVGNIILLNLKEDRRVFHVISVTAVMSLILNVCLIAWLKVYGAILALILTELTALVLYSKESRKLNIRLLNGLEWLPKKLVIPIPEEELLQVSQVELRDLTLIIPTYNRLDVWPDLLETIAVQSMKPTEIIVIDQSGAEIHQELKALCLERLPMIHWRFILQNTPNRCMAKDRGIHEAKNGAVVIIDDDLWLSRNFISYYFEFLNTNKDSVLTTRIIETDRPVLASEKVQRYTWYGHFFNNNYSTRNAEDLVSVTGACFGFIMNDAVRDVHFEPNFIGTGIMEEPDLAYQLLKKGRRIVYKAEVTVCHFPQKNGNNNLKKTEPVRWYADSFYNFGYYHAKHHMQWLHWLRWPYIFVLSIHVASTRQGGLDLRLRGLLQNVKLMLTYYSKGYANYSR
jgi:O-antigen/teichoic acid export membrane protein/glycosyltransferase involved in cell wall biosynthesis